MNVCYLEHDIVLPMLDFLSFLDMMSYLFL